MAAGWLWTIVVQRLADDHPAGGVAGARLPAALRAHLAAPAADEPAALRGLYGRDPDRNARHGAERSVGIGVRRHHDAAGTWRGLRAAVCCRRPTWPPLGHLGAAAGFPAGLHHCGLGALAAAADQRQRGVAGLFAVRHSARGAARLAHRHVGLIFLLTWLASTVNALWEQGFNWRAVPAPLALFACALLATLGYGTARLLWPAPNQAPSVKVAAVTADHTAFGAAYGAINWGTFYQDTDAQRAALRPALAATVDPLLAQTDTALRGGAQLVSWSETAGLVLEEDKPAVIARAAALARQYHADVQITLGVLTHAKTLQFLRNQAILIDGTGAVVWTYDKSNPVVPNEALVVPFGTDVLPTVDRPYGRLGTVICQDIHYPRLLRQAAQGGATLVLDPSSDVNGLSDLDAGIASLRAIETGVTLVRPNGNGPTRIFDSWGRVLVEQADQPGGSRLLVATVPARHVWTLYGEVGDVFAYACVVGLIVLVGAAFVRRGQPAPAARAIPA